MLLMLPLCSCHRFQIYDIYTTHVYRGSVGAYDLLHEGVITLHCAQNLDPADYLIEVIKRLPHDAAPEQAAELTPARIATERKFRAETQADQVA